MRLVVCLLRVHCMWVLVLASLDVHVVANSYENFECYHHCDSSRTYVSPVTTIHPTTNVGVTASKLFNINVSNIEVTCADVSFNRLVLVHSTTDSC